MVAELHKVRNAESGRHNWWSEDTLTLEAPDLDGSFGKNADGVFFFTKAGQYVEWSGAYLYSNQRLTALEAKPLEPQ